MKKKLKNSNCDKTQKFKLLPNSKPKIVTELKNSNCKKNSKTQIVTKLKNPNCDKTKKHREIAKSCPEKSYWFLRCEVVFTNTITL